MERPSYAAAMQWMADAVPELRSLRDEHLDEFEEELPYVLFESDYMRWLVAAVRAGRRDEAVLTFLRCVETMLDGPDDPLRELGWIGFVEHLIGGGERDVLDLVSDELGPSTLAAVMALDEERGRRSALRERYSSCRCAEQDLVLGEAAAIYREHLLWIDQIAPGLDVFRCAETGWFWSSSDRRTNAPARMRRQAGEADAARALRRFQDRSVD